MSHLIVYHLPILPLLFKRTILDVCYVTILRYGFKNHKKLLRMVTTVLNTYYLNLLFKHLVRLAHSPFLLKCTTIIVNFLVC